MLLGFFKFSFVSIQRRWRWKAQVPRFGGEYYVLAKSSNSFNDDDNHDHPSYMKGAKGRLHFSDAYTHSLLFVDNGTGEKIWFLCIVMHRTPSPFMISTMHQCKWRACDRFFFLVDGVSQFIQFSIEMKNFLTFFWLSKPNRYMLHWMSTDLPMILILAYKLFTLS